MTGHTLVECSPAKFMVEDNLIECFDNFTKNGLRDGKGTATTTKEQLLKINKIIYFLHKVSFHFLDTYWCWSRKDVEENRIKKLTLSTSITRIDELIDLIKQPFKTIYLFNGTHIRCDSKENWAGLWFNIDVDSITPCVANTSLEVNVKYRSSNKNL